MTTNNNTTTTNDKKSMTRLASSPVRPHRDLLLSQLRAEAREVLRVQRKAEHEEEQMRQRREAEARLFAFEQFKQERDRQWRTLEQLLTTDTLEALDARVSEFTYMEDTHAFHPPYFELHYDHLIWPVELYIHDETANIAGVTVPYAEARQQLLLLLAEHDERVAAAHMLSVYHMHDDAEDAGDNTEELL